MKLGGEGSLRQHGAHLLLDLTFPFWRSFSALLLACEPCLSMSTEGSGERGGKKKRRNGVVSWYKNMDGRGERDEGSRKGNENGSAGVCCSSATSVP